MSAVMSATTGHFQPRLSRRTNSTHQADRRPNNPLAEPASVVRSRLCRKRARLACGRLRRRPHRPDSRVFRTAPHGLRYRFPRSNRWHGFRAQFARARSRHQRYLYGCVRSASGREDRTAARHGASLASPSMGRSRSDRHAVSHKSCDPDASRGTSSRLRSCRKRSRERGGLSARDDAPRSFLSDRSDQERFSSP